MNNIRKENHSNCGNYDENLLHPIKSRRIGKGKLISRRHVKWQHLFAFYLVRFQLYEMATKHRQ